ncbi:MAG: hypothetical protein IJ637_06395, partial [Prevotella sp.]|nr:hypothetical protein [Prevotella sp.]
GNIYGAGKGDPRVHFNKVTNVKDVEIELTGGIIYGSVYGGGEDGHVLRDVKMTIGSESDHTGPTIGTWGTTYVDGNVFGGGRGFSGDAYTAGNVAGCVDLTIHGGNILGSVYGGGRLGSVGYGLFDATTDGSSTPGYGEMRKDTDTEEGFSTSGFFTNGRGHINMTITGGTIGNDYEYVYNPTAALKSSTMPLTEFDSDNHLMHTKGGNVFAGGMGRMYQLDGTTAISAVDWWKMGNVKTTKLTITGGTIKSSVYGGGELGFVQGGTHTSADGKAMSTEISISGGTIGTEITTKVGESDVTQYTYGSVFGGGYGSLVEKLTHAPSVSYPKYIAGRVKGSTAVTISGSAAIKASVYGGGEMAAVGESKALDEAITTGLTSDTYVTISGGTIGKSGCGGAKMGNVYGGGSGSYNTVRSGQIYGNTNIAISDGTIYHNVYGGGAYGTVGDFTYTTTDVLGAPKVTGITGLHSERTGTGTATINITGGTIGTDGNENGMVFGSSRGDINEPGQRDDYTAWVYDANITIGTAATPATGTEGEEGYVAATAESGPDIKGSVYGSGENGHTYNNTVLTVNGGTIGIASGGAIGGLSGAAYPYRGNVYGGGCGTDMYDSDSDGTEDAYNPLAGVVYGNSTVNINGGHVVRNVYGAGAMGSVGKASDATSGTTQVNISGGIIGVDGNDNGNVFGSARGADGISTSLANVMTSEVNIQSGANVWGSVFGGGEAGFVKGSVAVNMLGGEVKHDVYGGGALANTNTANWDATKNEGAGGWADGMYNSTTYATTYKTNVTLKGGTVGNNVYGGGLGRMAATDVSAVEAKVYGDVLVTLNGTKKATGEAPNITYSYTDNCVVKNTIFGCNNLNGSPQSAVTVHVSKTQGWTDGTGSSAVSHDVSAGKSDETVAKGTGVYEVAAVYGGGNLAAYNPDLKATADTAVAHVIIDGCDLTSIGSVYGGGNAASSPATNVTVNGTYEIGEVFGGGNGKDALPNGDPNPGANVGYKNYTVYKMEAGKMVAKDSVDYDTKEKRTAEGSAIVYGSGRTQVTIYGGTIHAVYGGSNTKGNVRIASVALLDGETNQSCDFDVDEAYGGGKNADMDGSATLQMICIKGLSEVYGGAKNADVNSNVTLNITNGTYSQVFGGNNIGGRINGSITVNIEETGCRPVVIGELYGGGNQACYSVYGYKNSGRTDSDGKTIWEPYRSSSETGARSEAEKYDDPVVNVKSFTSIGTIFGGGYGASATMVANPTVNIDEVEPETKFTTDNKTVIPDTAKVVGSTVMKPADDGYDSTEGFAIPSHEKGKIGAIGRVFGGGNAAAVVGNTTVNVGTRIGENIDMVTLPKVDDAYQRRQVKGVDIRGNVFGGGNQAEVTGHTNVVIGKSKD